MDKLQEHLIAKNVASEIAQKVCSNVAQNLEGIIKQFLTIKK